MEDNKNSIKVDIEELMAKLEAMIEDDYATVKLTLNSDGYDTELELNAIGLDEDDIMSYGELSDLGSDML